MHPNRSFSYAVDKDSSKLLFSSVLGASGTVSTNDEGKVVYTQNLATDSSNEIIKSTATELLSQSSTGKIEVRLWWFVTVVPN